MGSIPPANAEKAFDILRDIGAIIDLRNNVHQKVIIVDDDVFYNGSLNVLSTRLNAEEFMMRIESRAACVAFAQNDRWRKAKKCTKNVDDADVLDEFAKEENPRCPACGGLMAYITPKSSSKQPFLKCIDASCGKFLGTQNLDKKVPDWIDMNHAIPCEKCGGNMSPRRSRKGTYFWSCENYPKCKPDYRGVKKSDFEEE